MVLCLFTHFGPRLARRQSGGLFWVTACQLRDGGESKCRCRSFQICDRRLPAQFCRRRHPRKGDQRVCRPEGMRSGIAFVCPVYAFIKALNLPISGLCPQGSNSFDRTNRIFSQFLPPARWDLRPGGMKLGKGPITGRMCIK